MSNRIQPITLHGRTVACAAADELIIAEDVDPDDLPVIETMGLVALQIQSGQLPGPYTDEHALRMTLRAVDDGLPPHNPAKHGLRAA